MRKIKYYNEDSFVFYKNIVSAKRGAEKKKQLESLESNIEKQFCEYKHYFENNSLFLLRPMSAAKADGDLLRGLYQFSQKKIKELFVYLTTTETNKRDMVCPNCTINDSCQLDHYVPKGSFPEFSVNPLNLIPCCSRCNLKKEDRWLDAGKTPVFLNLYLDSLPQEQYLFVHIKMDAGVPRFTFCVENKFGIEASLFRRIESHYQALNLCARFVEQTGRVISDMLVDYKSIRSKIEISSDCFWEIQRDKALENQKEYGYNYWKSILILACCDNKEFRKLIESRCSEW